MEVRTMKTYFASPLRSDSRELAYQIGIATHHPVVDGMIRMVGGLVAVLNEHRQIIALNQSMLDALGETSAKSLLGLRPGEAVGCRYADEMDAGCGTSEYCMTCGAAIAIVSSLGGNRPVQRNCAISVQRNGRSEELFFRVHAAPILVEGQTFVLLMLNDISEFQRMAAMQRVFFHDINNTITGLLQAGELLKQTGSGSNGNLPGTIADLTMRLCREVDLQRRLSQQTVSFSEIQAERISVEWIIGELERWIDFHPSHQDKVLQVQNGAPGLLLRTDPVLLLRVLGNMLVNAFEAATRCRTIRLNVTAYGGQVNFGVWNADVISPAVAIRIFQRNFTTKDESGRGLGTYTMKLIGEELLGGRVHFESSAVEGTTFFLTLPIKDTERSNSG
jgi:signal transduction histidine kinase